MSSIKKFLYGLLIGVVNIMLGAGGGMLTVPFYKKIGLSQKQAQINAVATILPISVISAFIYLYNGEAGKSSKFSKWFFYWFYPVHLGIVYLISLI